MGFDHFGGLCAALNDIRVDRALRKEVDTRELAGLLLEHADEFRADDLALLLRIGNACEFREEAFARVHINEIRVHLVAEHLDHLLRLTLTQQAVVDMHTGELIANRL